MEFLRTKLPVSNHTEGVVSKLEWVIRHTHRDISCTRGDIRRTHGDIRRTHGDIRLTHWDIRRTRGDIILSHGDIRHTRGDSRLTYGDIRLITNGDIRLTHGKNHRVITKFIFRKAHVLSIVVFLHRVYPKGVVLMAPLCDRYVATLAGFHDPFYSGSGVTRGPACYIHLFTRILAQSIVHIHDFRLS